MQRDLDLVRQLLKVIEEAEYPPDHPIVIEGLDASQVNYHLLLMKEAQLIDAYVSEHLGPGVPEVLVNRLTWEGHEFLEASRSAAAWKEAMRRVSKTSGGLAFEVIKAALIHYAKSRVFDGWS